MEVAGWLLDKSAAARAIPDLLIADSELHHRLGVVHVGRNYERIAEVLDLAVRRMV